jgi:hypothetical protein
VILAKDRIVPDVVDNVSDKAAFKVGCLQCAKRTQGGAHTPLWRRQQRQCARGVRSGTAATVQHAHHDRA